MLPDDHPDRIQIAFHDHRLVDNAGLILPATLGRHLGLPQLVDRRLGLGDGPGRADTGDKIMTLVASALAGGDCIDDADVLRTGGTARGAAQVKAPSTLGTFLPGYLPAQLPVGARPPAGPGEPRAAGPGLGCWSGTRRRAPDHRPGLHHLRDLSTNWSFHAATGPPYSVGVSPEGVIGNAQSIQRDRPTAGRHQ